MSLECYSCERALGHGEYVFNLVADSEGGFEAPFCRGGCGVEYVHLPLCPLFLLCVLCSSYLV